MSTMRILKGDVDLVGLGHVLQLLSLHRCQGVLTVARGRDRASIHLGSDGLRLLSSTAPRVKRVARLARRLLASRPLSPVALKSILKKERLPVWTLGSLDPSPEAASKENVQEALRAHVEEEVLDLFTWSCATFGFVERRLPKSASPLLRLPLRADVTSLLLEAARRDDELLQIRKLLSDEGARVVRLPREIHADELGEDVFRVDAVLPLINGRRTLQAILKASIYPRFATLRAIHRLVRLGHATARSPSGRALEAQPIP